MLYSAGTVQLTKFWVLVVTANKSVSDGYSWRSVSISCCALSSSTSRTARISLGFGGSPKKVLKAVNAVGSKVALKIVFLNQLQSIFELCARVTTAFKYCMSS